MRYFIIILLLGCAGISCSQNLFNRSTNYTTRSKKAIELFRQGDNYRVRGQYSEAVYYLKDALRKDDKFAEAWYMLGMTYKMTFRLEESIQAFESALTFFPAENTPNQLRFELGQVYMHIGQYGKAEKHMTDYLEAGGYGMKNAVWARKALLDVEFARENIGNPVDFKPVMLSPKVNTFNMQYFPVLSADQRILIYTKRGPSDDEDLVVSFKDADGNWSAPGSISDNINSRWNEGTCAISADASVLIFTTCQGRDSYGSCDLYISRRTGSDWSIPENMGQRVNSPYWDSQPSLSADGRTLYFVSTRGGGKGSKDIWVTQVLPDGTWSQPVNAGDGINTPFDEVSPFIHANGSTLYFASKGFPGFGGFDIYYTELRKNWKMPKNLGYPVNTSKDQVSLFISADGKKAMYSDESMGGMGMNSRLFEFDIPEEMQVEITTNYVYGKVLDEKTKKPVGAEVELFNLSQDEPVSIMKSDRVTGNYLMVLPEGAEYALYVEGEGYLFESLNFDYHDSISTEPVYRDVLLKKASSGSSVVLNNLFFDYAKFDLRPESKVELNKVISFLSTNPEVKIEISGHTDNTGSRSVNQTLSTNRANSVYKYLVSSGVSPERLSFRGYADSRPIASNDTEANRARNRRIEMEIR